jgi:hypothetical protein
MPDSLKPSQRRLWVGTEFRALKELLNKTPAAQEHYFSLVRDYVANVLSIETRSAADVTEQIQADVSLQTNRISTAKDVANALSDVQGDVVLRQMISLLLFSQFAYLDMHFSLDTFDGVAMLAIPLMRVLFPPWVVSPELDRDTRNTFCFHLAHSFSELTTPAVNTWHLREGTVDYLDELDRAQSGTKPIGSRVSGRDVMNVLRRFFGVGEPTRLLPGWSTTEVSDLEGSDSTIRLVGRYHLMTYPYGITGQSSNPADYQTERFRAFIDLMTIITKMTPIQRGGSIEAFKKLAYTMISSQTSINVTMMAVSNTMAQLSICPAFFPVINGQTQENTVMKAFRFEFAPRHILSLALMPRANSMTLRDPSYDIFWDGLAKHQMADIIVSVLALVNQLLVAPQWRKTTRFDIAMKISKGILMDSTFEKFLTAYRENFNFQEIADWSRIPVHQCWSDGFSAVVEHLNVHSGFYGWVNSFVYDRQLLPQVLTPFKSLWWLGDTFDGEALSFDEVRKALVQRALPELQAKNRQKNRGKVYYGFPVRVELQISDGPPPRQPSPVEASNDDITIMKLIVYGRWGQLFQRQHEIQSSFLEDPSWTAYGVLFDGSSYDLLSTLTDTAVTPKFRLDLGYSGEKPSRVIQSR